MRRQGLTLVELVVAMAITTLLVVASLKVVSTLAKTERVASAAEETDALETGLRSLLAADLVNADRMRETAAGGVTIRTHTYLAQTGGPPEQLPSLVTYEIKKVGQRSLLFRRQQGLSEPETVDLVAAGVQAIRIAGAGNTTPDGWQGLAPAVAVTLEFGKDAKTDIVIRRQ